MWLWTIVQSPSCGQPFATPWTAACQASLSLTISWCLPEFTSIASVMLSKHLTPVALFSFCLQSFPASGSFPVSWLFTSGDQSIGASASILLKSIQGWFKIGLISMLPKGLSEVFSSTTVWKHQLVGALSSLPSSSHNHMWLLEKP